jgi:CxxC motif-containing protein (DUF1111 family)
MRTALTIGAFALMVAGLTLGHAALSADGVLTSGIDGDGDFRRRLGETLFRRAWVSAPASTASADGLGPLYNARACAQCHPEGGRGQPVAAGGFPSALVARLSQATPAGGEQGAPTQSEAEAQPDPTYGAQLQPFAIQGHQAEGRVEISYAPLPVNLSGGEVVTLRKPSYRLVELNYGPLGRSTHVSPRVAPALTGLGLLEQIPDRQILERANAPSAAAVAGTVNWVWSRQDGRKAIGRFGWKATGGSLRQQVANAFALDLGLSSALVDRPAGDCTTAQPRCMDAPHGNSPHQDGHEIGNIQLDLVVEYVRSAITVAPSPPSSPAMRRGKTLFEGVGCAGCHRPSFTLADGRVVWPYSDLLSHDMGAALADEGSDDLPSGRTWRTPPLWGHARSQTTSEPTYLHDGRARGSEEAILWHDGQGRAARDAYIQLPLEDRRALLDFLRSL